MATLAVFLEPPVVVGPSGKKPDPQGQGQNGELDRRRTHHSVVSKVHCRLHEQHRDHAHSDRSTERLLGAHLLPKNEGFQYHAGHDSRDHGRDPYQGPELAGDSSRGMIFLKKVDCTQVPDGTSQEAKEGVLG